MNGPILYVIGTPDGRWPEWGRTCLEGTPYARDFAVPAAAAGQPTLDSDGVTSWLPPQGHDMPWGGVAEEGWRAVETLTALLPGARFVVLVESPGLVLAAALERGFSFDPELVLARWRAGARQLLRLVQMHRDRCVLLDAGEARVAPHQAWLAATSRLPGVLPSVPSGVTIHTDVVCETIAAELVRERTDLQTVHAGLLAACEELGLPAPLPSADKAEVVRQFMAMRASARTERQSGGQLQAARGQLTMQAADAAQAAVASAAQKTEFDEAQHRLRETKAALEACEQRVTAAEHLAQAHASQVGGLESALSTLRDSSAGPQAHAIELQQQNDQHRQTADAEQARLQEALRGAQATAGDLRAELRQRELELETLRTERAQLRGELEQRVTAARTGSEASLEAEAQKLRHRTDEAVKEAASLLVQLHETQEALELADSRRRQLEAAQLAAVARAGAAPAPNLNAASPAASPPRAPAPAVTAAAIAPSAAKPAAAPPAAPPGAFTIGEVKLTATHNDPPYLGTTFALRRIKTAERELPEGTVRLVEHHGHPGLVVFGGAGRPALLQNWAESGVEDERPYQLLMPSDAACAGAFDKLSCDDWQLLLTIATRLEAELRATAGAKRERWIMLARRLGDQLREMAPRLRFAGAAATALDHGDWLIRCERVHWGVRDLSGLTLRWHPDSNLVALQFVDGRVPLLSWPSGPDGNPPAELVVPMGRQAPDEARQQWARLPVTDRQFVTELLAAWPELVARARWPDKAPAPDLSAAALRLRAEAAPLRPLEAGSTGLSALLLRAARRLRDRGPGR